MGKNIINSIKREAKNKGVVIQDSNCEKIMVLLNKAFFLPKDPEKESAFVKQVITRGLDGQERVGLHASSLISEERDYCLRKQVLALCYKQAQGEELPVNLKRIFEEGNAVHEKWQRMFLRAGYSEVKDLDRTRFKKEWMLSYSPDIICEFPEFGKMVGEIKSVNAYQFDKMEKHPTAWKQLQWYMYLTGIHQGFVLCENKNNQEFKIEYYKFDEKIVEPFIKRTEDIIYAYNRFIKKKKMVARPSVCDSPECSFCCDCPLKNPCWFKDKREKL